MDKNVIVVEDLLKEYDVTLFQVDTGKKIVITDKAKIQTNPIFKNAIISGNISGDKKEINLQFSEVKKGLFSHISAKKISFINVYLDDVRFIKSQLTSAVFINCTFNKVSFDGCNLDKTYFIGCKVISEVKMEQSNLDHSLWYASDFDKIEKGVNEKANTTENIVVIKQMNDAEPMKEAIYSTASYEQTLIKNEVYENQSFPISFFENKLFKNCTFESCDIYKENEMSRIEYTTDFKNCIFTNFNFSNVIYYKISFDECVFEKLILHGQFTHCCFAGSTFNECEINENSSFNYCNFSLVDAGSLNFDVLEDNQADKLFVGLANFVESEANLEEKNNSSAIANQEQIEAIKFIFEDVIDSFTKYIPSVFKENEHLQLLLENTKHVVANAELKEVKREFDQEDINNFIVSLSDKEFMQWQMEVIEKRITAAKDKEVSKERVIRAI